MRFQPALAAAAAALLLLCGCAHSAVIDPRIPEHILPTPAAAGTGGQETEPPGLFPCGFPLIRQKPELPNGCEITCLAMLLRHAGFDVDKIELAERYLPRVDFTETDGVRLGPDPDRAYAGDPATDKGWYCFEGPILDAAKGYLARHGGGWRAAKVSCVVLAGRDGGDFLVADPMNGWRRVPAHLLMDSYEAMGSRAVALLRAD